MASHSRPTIGSWLWTRRGELVRPIIRISDQTGADWILAQIFPFVGERFVGTKQAIETTFLPCPRLNRRRAVWHRRPTILFVEPAFEPFRECGDRCFTIKRCSQKMQMIWHSDRGERGPLIQTGENLQVNFPCSSIGQNGPK